LLADRLQDFRTSNVVISELIKYATDNSVVPRSSTVAHVYKSTVAGNPLRRLMRDFWVLNGCLDARVDTDAEPVPGLVEALLDIYHESIRLLRRDDSARILNVFWQHLEARRKCYYHVHGQGVPACEPEREIIVPSRPVSPVLAERGIVGPWRPVAFIPERPKASDLKLRGPRWR